MKLSIILILCCNLSYAYTPRCSLRPKVSSKEMKQVFKFRTLHTDDLFKCVRLLEIHMARLKKGKISILVDNKNKAAWNHEDVTL